MNSIGGFSRVAIAASVVVSFPSLALAQTAASCAALAATKIGAAQIGAPSGGVVIASAEIQTVAADPTNAGATREYCKVLGNVAPVDPAAPPVRFEVNLPLQWNGKALQYGGGGTNGVLITGLAPLRDARADTPVPVARGFATWGTDSGHDNRQLAEPHGFALNREALINMAYAAYKKTHDAGEQIAAAFYGRAPSKTYFYGGSEGGREAMVMAQRYPADFDAIVSAVPVVNYTGINLVEARLAPLEQNGGWLNPQKVKALKAAVNAACDRLDGLADGVISAYEKCLATFDPAVMRCAGGADTGNDCLSDAQIEADRVVHRPLVYPFPFANGVSSFPGWTYGSEDQPGGMIDSITGMQPPRFPPESEKGQAVRWTNYSGFVRYFVARDAEYNPFNFSAKDCAPRLMELSQLFDATNPDLSAFAGHGGRLIIKGNGADYQRSVLQEINYYRAVVARLGQARVDQFVRFYVTPGVNHPGNGLLSSGDSVPAKVDLLGVLDDWTEHGKAPGPLVQVAQERGVPFNVTASRPMCLYPEFPRYDGSGDPKQASSFRCAK